MKIRARVVVPGGLAFIVAATTAVVATGDPYPGANAGGADDKAHWACWVPDPGTEFIPWALKFYLNFLEGYMNNAAGITVPWSSTCAAGTDMFLDDRLSNSGLYGLRTCRVAIVNNVCGESSVMINDSKIVADATNAGLSPDAVREYNWCHEGGHSLGLDHDTYSCMMTGLNTVDTYSGHDIDHIDEDLQP